LRSPGNWLPGRKRSIRRSAWCWTWTARRSRCTGSRRTAPTTGTSSPPAITRCCCSTLRATVSRRSCGRATCIVRKTGQNCYCRKLSTNKNSGRKWCFAPMLPLPSRRFTRRWRSEASSMPFAYPPTIEAEPAVVTTAPPPGNGETENAPGPEVRAQIQTLLQRWTSSLRDHNLNEQMSCYASRLTAYFRQRDVTQDYVRRDKQRFLERY